MERAGLGAKPAVLIRAVVIASREGFERVLKSGT